MNRLIAAALVLGVSTAVYAQPGAVQGLGTLSCGNYIELRAKRDEGHDAALVSWIWGYMAGSNVESKYPTTASLPDQASTLAFVDKHCRENPLDRVLLATAALIKALGGRSNLR